MAADRLLPVSTTPGAVSGDDYMNAVQEEVTDLTNRAIYQLTSVSGTNTITANVEVPLTGGLIDGMRFLLVPAVTNTSTAVTLNIQSIGAKDIVDNLGIAPRVGTLISGGKFLLEYDSGVDKFYVLSYLPAATFDDRPSFRNILINGGMEIWQRSGSVAVAASTTAYTVDRWYMTTNANQACTVSQGIFGDNRSRFAAILQRNSGQTGTGTLIFACPLTLDEVIRLRGEKAALQFRSTPGANFSPTSGTVNYAFYVGTGAEGKRGGGFTSETTVITGSVNVTATQTVTVVSAAAVPTTATQGEVRYTWTPTGTALGADFFVLDDVQLESGTANTEFEYPPFEYMLAHCMRHLEKTFPYATAPAQNAGIAGSITTIGIGDSSTARFAVADWRFKVSKRVSPTITTYNPVAGNANWRDVTAASNVITPDVNPSSVGSADHAFISSAADGTVAGANRDLMAIHALASAEL